MNVKFTKLMQADQKLVYVKNNSFYYVKVSEWFMVGVLVSKKTSWLEIHGICSPVFQFMDDWSMDMSRSYSRDGKPVMIKKGATEITIENLLCEVRESIVGFEEWFAKMLTPSGVLAELDLICGEVDSDYPSPTYLLIKVSCLLLEGRHNEAKESLNEYFNMCDRHQTRWGRIDDDEKRVWYYDQAVLLKGFLERDPALAVSYLKGCAVGTSRLLFQ